jgi:hypothetical protein
MTRSISSPAWTSRGSQKRPLGRYGAAGTYLLFEGSLARVCDFLEDPESQIALWAFRQTQCLAFSVTRIESRVSVNYS